MTGSGGGRSLKLPSGKLLRVTGLIASDGNEYGVAEASDCFISGIVISLYTFALALSIISLIR